MYRCLNKRSFSNLYNVTQISPKQFVNEPILSYKQGSNERKTLQEELDKLSREELDIPIVIGNEEIKTDSIQYQKMPFNHKFNVAKFYHADSSTIEKAIDVALKNRKRWEQTDWSEKIKIFEKAGDLIAGPYRQKLNAATMLGQAKTIMQAEIDAACELPDFIRSNVFFLSQLLQYQPISPELDKYKNYNRYRGCEGFWAAISPFNFTAIGGNLACSPIIMGNAVLWKPSCNAILSSWIVFEAFREAGLPPGVLNFIPADGKVFGDTITKSIDLAGINYTGSVDVFNKLWQQVAENINVYKSYPRLIGELGGKNYHFVHLSANSKHVINSTIRSAFEYSGQKCSACSILYLPSSTYEKIKVDLVEAAELIAVCHPIKFNAFMSAVINKCAFDKIKSIMDYVATCDDLVLLTGGSYDDSIGYYIEPTIILCKDHNNRLMKEEIFGPILLIYVYKDDEIEDMMKVIEEESVYALCGAVFGQDRDFLAKALDTFKMSAGNLYINDKSTGSLVGQQPFGGARRSGTNEKVGGPYYLLRFTNPQTIKENFVELDDYNYPYLECEPCSESKNG